MRSVPVELALCAAMGGSCSAIDSTHSRVCPSLLEKPGAELKSVRAVETQGILQPMRRLYACSLSSGACERKVNVTSRACRCGSRPSMPSAIDEHVGQPASSLGPTLQA